MKLMHVLAAAGVATTMIVPTVSAPAQVAVTIGAPAGPGWNTYRERRWRRGWDGPRYWNRAGPHRGYYAWNNGYYRNCSYRWVGRNRHREWRCW